MVADELISDADQHRLAFAMPYALTAQGLAKAGQREYTEAHELFDEAEQRALRAGDRASYHTVWAARTRVHVAQAAFDRVLSRPLKPDSDITNQLKSEVTSSYALAVVGAGHLDRAEELARSAAEKSIGTETRICSHLALALVESHRGNREQALEYARQGLAAATLTGMVEAFVFAYRGLPEVLVVLLEDPNVHDDVSDVLTLVGDAWLAEVPSRGHSILRLSPREKEVLSLLAQGLSNREIRGCSLHQPCDSQGARPPHIRQAGSEVTHCRSNARFSTQPRGLMAFKQLLRLAAVPDLTPSRRSRSQQSFRGDNHRRLSPGWPQKPRPPLCRTATRQTVRGEVEPLGSASRRDMADPRSSRCMRRQRR